MLHYGIREFQRALKTRNVKFYVLGIVIVSVIANLTIIAFRNYVYGTNDGTYGYNIIMFAGGFFWIPYYTTIFISDMVFGKEYPDPFIKDRFTRRLRRSHLYLGKLIASWMMLIILVILAAIIFIGISTLFQMSTDSLSMDVTADFAVNLACAMPLFMAGCAIAMMCLFAFMQKKKAFLAFWIITIIIPRIIMILGAEPLSIRAFKFMKDKLLLTPQFTTLQFYASRDVPLIIITSVTYIALTTVAGIIVFRSKKVFNPVTEESKNA